MKRNYIGRRTGDVNEIVQSVMNWINSHGIVILLFVLTVYFLNKCRTGQRGNYEQPRRREYLPLTPEEIEREKEFEERRRQLVEKQQKKFNKESTKYHEAIKEEKIKALDKKLEDITFLNTYEEKPSDARIHRPPPNVMRSVSGRSLNTTTNSDSETTNNDSSLEYNMITLDTTIKCLAKIDNVVWEVLIDTGACRSIISPRLLKYSSAQIKYVPRHLKLYGANNLPVEVTGSVLVNITVGGVTFPHEVLVAKEPVENLILGCDFHRKHQLQLDLSTCILMYRGGNPVEFTTPGDPNQAELLWLTRTYHEDSSE